MFFELFVLFGVAWWILTIAISAAVLFFLGWGTELDDPDESKPFGKACSAVILLGLLAWFFLGNLKDLMFRGGFNWYVFWGYVAGYILAGCVWGLFKWDRKVRKRRETYDNWKVEWLKQNGVIDATERTAIPENLLDKWEKFILKKPGWSVNTEITGNVVQITRSFSGMAVFDGDLVKSVADRLEDYCHKKGWNVDVAMSQKRPGDSGPIIKEFLEELEKTNPQFVGRVESSSPETVRKTVVQRHIDPRNHKGTITVWCAYWPWDAGRYFLYDFVIQLWNKITTSLFRVMRKITTWRMAGTEKDFRP